MNLRSPWPPLLLTLALLASCFVPGSVSNLAAKQGLTLLGEVGQDDPHEFVTNGVGIYDSGGSVYVPSLVSHKTMQDLQRAAQAWDVANPPDPAAPPDFHTNPYREMLDTVQHDVDQFAGGDVDRLGNLWDYFSSFWFFQR
ncbi:hypothetical protein [Deinococcus sp. Marseille-Q6407]|uniref:hypothetical protein n=1 Tax=Deinococcus sp. Marseille-Q6407 TaxID=2969223 RepID=UPI0021BE6939|nr:hypothetical protein [Deinococcus sp. Marseille-Q6407]